MSAVRCDCCGKFRKKTDVAGLWGEDDERWTECRFCMSESDRERYFKNCSDIDGTALSVGDVVELFFAIGKPETKTGEGVIWAIGDMNEEQKNMPYIRGKGAWHPRGLRKIIGGAK